MGNMFSLTLTLVLILFLFAGIIVAGRTGSGKSTCIQTVVEALCLQARGTSRQSQVSKASQSSENVHKLQRMYPMMVDDLSLMFGSLDQNGDWVDGMVTHAIRKANRVGWDDIFWHYCFLSTGVYQ